MLYYDKMSKNCETEINNVAHIQTCQLNSKLPWFDNEVYNKIKT